MDKTDAFVILLVEDNDIDAEFTIRALKQFMPADHVIRLADGQDALDYFFADENGKQNEEKTKPKLILLDNKLPRISGLEVLKELKNHKQTKNIPVVMLTSSTESQDIISCYKYGGNSYIAKPVGFEKFLDTIRTLGLYWLSLNRAP